MAKIRTEDLPEVIPAWLPPKCCVTGDFDAVIGRLYSIFSIDFKGEYPQYAGRKVFWDTNFDHGEEYEKGFWHVVGRDSALAAKRCLDEYRAERLPWCRPIITDPGQPELLVWRYYHSGSKIRVYLWLNDYNYVVVLEERKNSYFLISAHHLDGKHRILDMEKRYRNRIKD